MFLNKKILFINGLLKLLIIILFFLINKKIILKIPLFAKPLVSIIIPVHNNFRFTYNCISSILKADPIVPYEILIGNDMSTDNTRIIDKFITNIRVHDNNEKYNFLLNCNEMTKFTRGKY